MAKRSDDLIWKVLDEGELIAVFAHAEDGRTFISSNGHPGMQLVAVKYPAGPHPTPLAALRAAAAQRAAAMHQSHS